jgi:hypothetical protein
MPYIRSYNMSSRTVKALSVFGCIILGYVMMFFGWNPHLPNGHGESLFFGGALLVLCAGVYGIVGVVRMIRRSFND